MPAQRQQRLIRPHPDEGARCFGREGHPAGGGEVDERAEDVDCEGRVEVDQAMRDEDLALVDEEVEAAPQRRGGVRLVREDARCRL